MDISLGKTYQSSSYIRYQKDPQELQKEREQREKQRLETFLTSLPEEKLRTAARFFWSHGAQKFVSQRVVDLKKDFRFVALRVHPDRFPSENEQTKRHFQEQFQTLQESFEALKTYFSLEK
jgi:hypothetical protein